MMSCRTETESVSLCRKLGHSIVVAAISQWRRCISACAGLTVDILSTFCDAFMV